MKTIAKIREEVACAEINLDNLAASVPGLDQHPFYKVVKYQLKCAQLDDDSGVELK